MKSKTYEAVLEPVILNSTIQLNQHETGGAMAPTRWPQKTAQQYDPVAFIIKLRPAMFRPYDSRCIWSSHQKHKWSGLNIPKRRKFPKKFYHWWRQLNRNSCLSGILGPRTSAHAREGLQRNHHRRPTWCFAWVISVILNIFQAFPRLSFRNFGIPSPYCVILCNMNEDIMLLLFEECSILFILFKIFTELSVRPLSAMCDH